MIGKQSIACQVHPGAGGALACSCRRPLLPALGARSGLRDDSVYVTSQAKGHAMIRHLAISLAVALAGAAQAQQWVQLSDPLAFDKLPPVWCNADRTACMISRQPFGATGAVRVALTVAG